MLLFLLLTVVVALVGGLAPALIAAVAGSLLLNYFFTPPLHTLTISETNNSLALLVFVAGGRRSSARRSTSPPGVPARPLARPPSPGPWPTSPAASWAASDGVGRDARARPGDLRADLGDAARDAARTAGSPVASAGPPVERPSEAETEVPAATSSCSPCVDPRCAPRTSAWSAPSPRRPPSCSTTCASAEAAAEAGPLAEANKVRTALLAAVGHDLRTPLAAAKAAVSSLRSLDIDLDAERPPRAARDRRRPPWTGWPALVDNLLDMSRLQAGAMSIDAAAHRGRRGHRASPRRPRRPTAVRIVVDLRRATSPLVLADPGLLERVLANLAANALRYAPPETPPHLSSSRLGDRVEIRVIDRGPGIPPGDHERVFLPFQRLGDTDNTTGVGLGLALSRGLTEAMGGTLEPEETPGGGLTMVVCPARRRLRPRPAPGRRERSRGQRHDPRARRRRRAPAAARAEHQPARPALRRRTSRPTAPRPSARRPPTRPTLVILDLGLPDMDGTEVIAGLRGWTDVPILVLSGRSDSATRSTPSTPAPTTTSPSRSAWTSCSPGCAR